MESTLMCLPLGARGPPVRAARLGRSRVSGKVTSGHCMGCLLKCRCGLVLCCDVCQMLPAPVAAVQDEFRWVYEKWRKYQSNSTQIKGEQEGERVWSVWSGLLTLVCRLLTLSS